MINGAIGTAASGVELGAGRLTIGDNFKFYSSGWRGNQYVSTARLSRFAKGIGVGTLVVGSALDGIGVRNYYKYGPDNPNSVNPAKAGLNLGVGLWGITKAAGIGGVIGGAIYFGIDTFHPGGWAGWANDYDRVQRENQAILGPGFITAPYGSQKF